LGPLDQSGAAYQVRQPARRLPGVLWAAVADPVDGLLGARADFWIRLRAVRTGRTSDARHRKNHVLESALSERRNFFTLGYGDITPNNAAARALAVMEAGMGFAFLGVVIGYLPVVYNSFAARETEISLLDARAGSPPSAAEFLGRLGCCPDLTVLDDIFRDWERWCADLLSSHISYPVLLFFRSQHSNQSWLSALTVMLDVTSLVMTGVEGIHPDQAKLTFAMARHAVVDLAQVVNSQYSPHDVDRLTAEDRTRLKTELAWRGVTLNDKAAGPERLAELRAVYEPYLHALSRRLLMTLPPWIHKNRMKDNWQGGPWDRAIQARALEHPGRAADDHF